MGIVPGMMMSLSTRIMSFEKKKKKKKEEKEYTTTLS